jgi:hypothetical protein
VETNLSKVPQLFTIRQPRARIKQRYFRDSGEFCDFAIWRLCDFQIPKSRNRKIRHECRAAKDLSFGGCCDLQNPSEPGPPLLAELL